MSKAKQQPQQEDAPRFIVDPYERVGWTHLNNAILYGEFPVTVRNPDGSIRKEKGKLSKPARMSYLGLRSLDWDDKQEVFYTWAKLCILLDLSRRALALHLEELEGAGLIRRTPRQADQLGGTHYIFTAMPLREVWRALMLKRHVTGRGTDDTAVAPGAKDRAEFNFHFNSAWWPTFGENKEDEYAQLRLERDFPNRK